MTNRIGDSNREFYLNILKNQTGLKNLTIGKDALGYVLENNNQPISRITNGTTMYEIILAMTRLLSDMKKVGVSQ
jgi:hypothetical protein